MLDIRIENPLRQTIASVKLMSVKLSYHSVFSASYEPSMLDIRIENPLRQTIAPAKLRGAFSTTSHVMPSLRNTQHTPTYRSSRGVRIRVYYYTRIRIQPQRFRIQRLGSNIEQKMFDIVFRALYRFATL
jgi:hypothetical protein